MRLAISTTETLTDLKTDLVVANNNNNILQQKGGGDAMPTYCVQVANRVTKRNNGLKALAGTNWGQQKETLLLTYKALERSIVNYAALVWSTNASDTSFGKIQRTQNEALRIITGSHKMSSIDHLHSETKILLVEDHLNLLSAQYLIHCLDSRLSDQVY